MRRKGTTDWPLLWLAVKDNLGGFFTLLGMGLCFGVVGGGVFYLGFGEWGAMIFGAFFALIGSFLFIYSFVATYSSIGYYYEQALLRKHGVEVDGVLIRKEADCQFHQEYDNNNRPLGDGYYQCNLLVEFDFQFNGQDCSGAFYLNKAELFDKLNEGDPLPLKVLKLDPSIHTVRERRLANMLKGRKPQTPSLIPEGAEISQLV
ncbi:hypothetical protein GCM10011362_27130 [Marinobacter halophilus]|uniref:DUF3592 domain-containing protein n=2 Tax=Marinobacter halophilus TaxID=1323740 RepID=A0A2T1KA12_9GAMM|nr:DUF3592 domain-containing protein [Marinobacter halophilus]GGC77070.1 hypothetical protein GCM10011362_27130 [Marinobacter halophilus]